MIKYKLKDVASEEFIEGLEAGLEIAKDVCMRNGFEIVFPPIDEIEIERDDKK